jgi:hypothetical protein
MAVTAYFDASGLPDDGSVLVVSGFVSSARRWARFDSEWSKILQDSGIRIFHMKEFAHSTGEFKNWKPEEEKRRKLSGSHRCPRQQSGAAFAVRTPGRREVRTG